MKRSWLIFKCTVLVAAAAFLVSMMGLLHTVIDRWANKAMAEIDKEAP